MPRPMRAYVIASTLRHNIGRIYIFEFSTKSRDSHNILIDDYFISAESYYTNKRKKHRSFICVAFNCAERATEKERERENHVQFNFTQSGRTQISSLVSRNELFIHNANRSICWRRTKHTLDTQFRGHRSRAYHLLRTYIRNATRHAILLYEAPTL